MIRGAGRINAVAVAQRGASLASALPTLAAHPPLRAAGAGNASAADPHVGAARPVHASRLSCLAAGYTSASAAHLIIRAARPVEAGFARGTTHTGASAGGACEALAAITRSG